MAGGRPLKFKTVEDLDEKIEAYFSECKETDKPMTITGLALALDTTRETILDYEDRKEFSDTIKRAKLRCQEYTENYLYTGKNATGAIFSLKNNYGWVDRTEVDNNVNVGVQISGRQAEQLLAARRNRTIVEGDSTEG